MYDLAIIGGGVNGCGIARDAAGRGLKVLLVEKGDLASGTSSVSTKLIHGGLRYLEHYEFRLVSEALAEREVLWEMAPHIVWPLRFILPHHRALRPAWMIRLGLLLYDRLGMRRRLPASRVLDLAREARGLSLRPEFRRGFEYSDCWVDDARLVVLNAVDAARRGADVQVATEMMAARREDLHWAIELRKADTSETSLQQARVLVNAAGPWVGSVLSARIGRNAHAGVRLVKGSHIIVPRIFEDERALIFQNADQRIVFAIPYEQDFTLIGTTDVEFAGDPATVHIDEAEVEYLCSAVSSYFARPVTPDQVVWTYSGVRPLYDDGEAAQSVTRDFVLELDAPRGEAPLLCIFGGKITTYRRLAEAALTRLGPWLAHAGPAWTRGAVLPGGNFPASGFEQLVDRLTREHPCLPEQTIRRFARAYGTRGFELLQDCRGIEDLGVRFGADLYQREIEWLIAEEWARSADDVLWRRSKLGLRLASAEREQLAAWMASRLKVPASPLPQR